MKKTILGLAVTAAIIFSSCQSPAEKTDTARENVKDAKEDLKAAQKDSGIAAVKTANAEEWKAFKAESELKIDNNNIRIDEIKIKMKTAGKTQGAFYESKIDSLQVKNAGLKTRMYNYEKGKTDWESFKSEFNHDMDALGKALKDFTVSGKK